MTCASYMGLLLNTRLLTSTKHFSTHMLLILYYLSNSEFDSSWLKWRDRLFFSNDNLQMNTYITISSSFDKTHTVRYISINDTKFDLTGKTMCMKVYLHKL